MRRLVLAVTLALARSAHAADAMSGAGPDPACLARIPLLQGEWRMVEPSADRPTIEARGDYDADGREDVALLLRPGAGRGRFAIATCLSSRPHGPPELIENAYTDGPISTTPKGTRYFDFDTERYGVYERDGIRSYCCDCCGATYILRAGTPGDGAFVEIVDSD